MRSERIGIDTYGRERKFALVMGIFIAAVGVKLGNELIQFFLSHKTVTIAWDASGGCVSGYNVYRSLENGKYDSPLNREPVPPAKEPKFSDTTAQVGKTYFYMVKASCYGVESPASNEIEVKVTERRRSAISLRQISFGIG